jgi:hypothetical protein
MDLVEKYLGEAIDPVQKSVAKEVNALFKKLGLKASVKSGAGKAGYIKTWVKNGIIPADLRNLALDVIYNPSFQRDRENPSAGNVSPEGITMRFGQWQELLSIYK